jgi:hypothetical protein
MRLQSTDLRSSVVFTSNAEFDPKQALSHLGREAPLVQLEVSDFTNWERAIKIHGNLGERHAATS